MKALLPLLLVIAGIVVALQLYIRFAPVDVDRWHVRPSVEGDGTADIEESGGFKALRSYEAPPSEVLSQLAAIAGVTPRTRVIAGTPGDGWMTFETRSLIWGFPDYTSVTAEPTAEGTELAIHGRLRFGGSDLGVNRQRIESWLAALDG